MYNFACGNLFNLLIFFPEPYTFLEIRLLLKFIRIEFQTGRKIGAFTSSRLQNKEYIFSPFYIWRYI